MGGSGHRFSVFSNVDAQVLSRLAAGGRCRIGPGIHLSFNQREAEE
jgi:hypothetical protein